MRLLEGRFDSTSSSEDGCTKLTVTNAVPGQAKQLGIFRGVVILTVYMCNLNDCLEARNLLIQ